MEKSAGDPPRDSDNNLNWSEAVEDLLSSGDTDAAISRLESVVSQLQLQPTPPSQAADLQLASALTELANLYSSNDFSLKSDELRSRAALLRHRALGSRVDDQDSDRFSSLCFAEVVIFSFDSCEGAVQKSSSHSAGGGDEASDDDWEAAADRAPSELLSPDCLPSVSEVSKKDEADKKPKRRGRGTFTYKKNGLYSDQQSDALVSDDEEDGEVGETSQSGESKHATYGTHHVLVLADFPPSTKTTDLERFVDGFKDRGVSIRWVNDTTALAVFRTPSVALEARNSVKFPFTVRILNDDDVLMSSISTKDLEPPRQRPQTSTRTAQRLIAQGMGLKLPSPGFGSRELKNQEEARKTRIVTRQKLRDDAWGDD
ncbi:unnamed protein product [Linum tenue]|uniref:Coiled-coil domain-containing protein R3HCC1L n=1 Tax=Linum tenue TaxID=586396 RepID=A0AAV0QFT4_9ROSI|nr:unnamed protein product [Linum tenue]